MTKETGGQAYSGFIIGLLFAILIGIGFGIFRIKSTNCPDLNIEGCQSITQFYADSCERMWSETYHALVQCQVDNDWSLQKYYDNPW